MKTIVVTGKRAKEVAPLVARKYGRPGEVIAVLCSTTKPKIKADLVLRASDVLATEPRAS